MPPRVRPFVGPSLIALVLCGLWSLRPLGLVDPARCPGLLERTLPHALRAASELPVGVLLSWTNGAAVLLSLAVFARLAQLLSGSLFVAAAVAAAIVATPAFERQLAPATHLVTLALGAYVFLLSAEWYRRGRAGWWLRARAAAAAALALVVAPQIAAPGFACVFPDDEATVSGGLASALGAIGPFPFGLAILGAFASRQLLRGPRAWAPVAFAGVALGCAMWAGYDAAAATPAIAGFWALAAIGLREVNVELKPRRRYRAAGAVLILLVPLLQLQRLHQRGGPERRAEYGHEHLSYERVWRALRGVPEARVVIEDASADLLLRAVAPRLRRSGKPLRLVERKGQDVGAARAEGRVFAFPLAQADLQRRGVQFTDTLQLGNDSGEAPGRLAGLAEVARVHPCTQPGLEWTDVTAALSTGSFALVAKRPDARGPVSIYVGSGGDVDATPAGWLLRDRRGFVPRKYLTQQPNVRTAVIDDGVPGSSPLLDTSHLLGLYLWRTHTAPDVLAVDLTHRPDVAVAREEPGTGRRGVQLCGVFAFAPRRIEDLRGR